MIEPNKTDDMAETTKDPGPDGRSRDCDDDIDMRIEELDKINTEFEIEEEYCDDDIDIRIEELDKINMEFENEEEYTSDIDKVVPEDTSDIEKVVPEESVTVTATKMNFRYSGKCYTLEISDIADGTKTTKETKGNKLIERLLKAGKNIFNSGRTLTKRPAKERVNKGSKFNVDDYPWLEKSHERLVIQERTKDMKTRIEELDLGDKIYRMSEGDKESKKCLIIANSKFNGSKDFKDLKACAVDYLYLSALFNRLNFAVEKRENLDKMAMKNFLVDEKSKLDGIECFVCVITSHGKPEGVLGSDCEVLEFREILHEFDGNNCRQLADKPKLFLFDVCRGKERDEVKAPGEEPTDSKMIPPRKSDILVAYATSNDYVAFSNSKYGSWFCRSFVHVVSENACSSSILDMLLMVNRLVGSFESEGCLQSAEFECSMRKQLFFSVPVIRQEEAKAADESIEE